MRIPLEFSLAAGWRGSEAPINSGGVCEVRSVGMWRLMNEEGGARTRTELRTSPSSTVSVVAHREMEKEGGTIGLISGVPDPSAPSQKCDEVGGREQIIQTVISVVFWRRWRG